MNTLRIALVDDSNIFCFIFEKIVEKYDKCQIEIMVFDNGKSALDFFTSASNQNVAFPQILFVDINMPILNGWQFLDALIESEHSLIKKSLFYIVSSSDNDIDLNKSKEYSIVKDFLNKPIDKNKLYSIFDKFLDT